MLAQDYDEYVDSNFEWSFLELTEKMQRYIEDDRRNLVKVHLPKKSVNYHRMTDLDMSRRFSKESEATVINVLEVFPKLVTSASAQKTGINFKEDVDRWSFDIFTLSFITNGHPMQALAYEIFKNYKLLPTFQLSEDTFMRFIIQVEKHYRLTPYHNACHAADVLQTVNCMISQTGFVNILTPMELFCILLTAIIHDIEHTGTNNSFHKNSGSEFARLYVVSVLENHHLRVGLRMMQEYDILKSLSKEKFDEFQYMVCAMILATDMANHFLLITNMKLMLSTTRDKGRMRIKRILLLLLHCADISNPAKPWDLHKSWVSLLIEEFFLQGDKERELKLPITPNCDRNTANIATLQIGFTQTFSKDTFVITDHLLEQELVQAGYIYIPYQPWHDCMEENMAKWNGKWKFLKYEQINELLAETPKPRMSISGNVHDKVQYKQSEKGVCLCCSCKKKRFPPSEEDSSIMVTIIQDTPAAQ